MVCRLVWHLTIFFGMGRTFLLIFIVIYNIVLKSIYPWAVDSNIFCLFLYKVSDIFPKKENTESINVTKYFWLI